MRIRAVRFQRYGRSGQEVRRGAAVTEFAVIVPLLVLLTLGAIDVGQLLNVSQTVSDAAREGARLAARRQTTDATDVENCVRDYVTNSYPNVPTGTWSTALAVTVTDDAKNELEGTKLAQLDSGELVQVQVSLTFNSVRWLHGTGFGSNKTLSITTVARRE